MTVFNDIKKLTVMSMAIALLAGCTQTIILFKPSPQVDPMPSTKNCENAVAGKQDPLFAKQWNLKQLGITQDVLKTTALEGNKNVKVAILSTGIDYNHEDLCGQVAIDKAEITQNAIGDDPGVNRKDDDGDGLVDNIVGWDVVDGDGLAYDRNGAGTAVAGIIAANQNNGLGIAGLMKNVTLYPVRYINDNGQTTVPWLVAGLEAAVKAKPHVIFLQNAQVQIGGWGGDPVQAAAELGMIKKALKEVHDAKIPVVVGAGDDMQVFGVKQLDQLFKSFDNVFVVTAVDKTGNISFLANIGEQEVMTAAPGENIMTTKPLNKYGIVNGTAYAAAHVTAALGLARSVLGDNMDYRKLATLLLSSKGSEQDPQLARFTRGGNRLQLVKFLGQLQSL